MPAQARLGDLAQGSADAHGCPACPHPVIGPLITGSPTVFVNGLPAARLNDTGIRAACCGPNMYQAVQGSATVLINGRGAVRSGDSTRHCGGVGSVIQGSPNVIVGG